MNLAELRAKGAFIDLSPVKRSVTWKHRANGTGSELLTDTFDVWVVRASFGTIDRLSREESQRSRNAELIAACIRLGENAEEEMPYDVAFSLHPSLALELVRAIGDVNRLKPPTKEEASAPKG